MIAKLYFSVSSLIILLSLFVLPGLILGQSTAQKIQARGGDRLNSNVREIDSRKEQQRRFAFSLVTSLADEARSYRNEILRARVLAHAANILWDADNDTGRLLFRRAWEAAEKGDANKQTAKNIELPQIAIDLQRTSGRDLRMEVLALATRCDRTLGEEFLAKLDSHNKSEAGSTKRDSVANAYDGWPSSNAEVKRLLVARRLLDDGEIERAVEFAAPVLNKVHINSIEFLAALRVKRPEIGDQWFARLLSRSELDPLSDANTVSGLSSYAFTPGLYVTFSANGSVRWSLEESDTPLNPPRLNEALRDEFFRIAASILLRPLSSEQDLSSAGRVGWSMVVKRLLPLFEQYAPERAVLLRGQLAASTGVTQEIIGDGHHIMMQGLKRNDTANEVIEKLQDRLDRARTTRERDSLYADAATQLANQGDLRAQDLTARIDKPSLRVQVAQYVNLKFIELAIKSRKGSDVIRFAKADQLTHTQRAWAYTQAARLLIDSDRQYALTILEDAANEARRLDGGDPDRARSLVAVSTELSTADSVRAWETMSDAVKAANSAPEFSGNSTQLRFAVATNSGLKIVAIGGAVFGLSDVFRALAKDDLHRSVDLAKSFRSEAPRAMATLAIASRILEQ